MHPRTAVLPSFPQKNDALRQFSQNRTGCFTPGKNLCYNSLEKKKKNSANFKVFLQHSMENKTGKKKGGEVEGKGEMKDGESS